MPPDSARASTSTRWRVSSLTTNTVNGPSASRSLAMPAPRKALDSTSKRPLDAMVRARVCPFEALSWTSTVCFDPVDEHAVRAAATAAAAREVVSFMGFGRFPVGAALLDGAGRTEHPDLDLTRFELAAPAEALPGRHALFGRTDRDRVLLSAPAGAGWRHRLVVGTRSWFDLDPADAPTPRFDLAATAARLAEREPERDGAAWRFDAGPQPSPELWFGGPTHALFEEHHRDLAASRLEPRAVVAAVQG